MLISSINPVSSMLLAIYFTIGCLIGFRVYKFALVDANSEDSKMNLFKTLLIDLAIMQVAYTVYSAVYFEFKGTDSVRFTLHLFSYGLALIIAAYGAAYVAKVKAFGNVVSYTLIFSTVKTSLGLLFIIIMTKIVEVAIVL